MKRHSTCSIFPGKIENWRVDYYFAQRNVSSVTSYLLNCPIFVVLPRNFLHTNLKVIFQICKPSKDAGSPEIGIQANCVMLLSLCGTGKGLDPLPERS